MDDGLDARRRILGRIDVGEEGDGGRIVVIPSRGPWRRSAAIRSERDVLSAYLLQLSFEQMEQVVLFHRAGGSRGRLVGLRVDAGIT